MNRKEILEEIFKDTAFDYIYSEEGMAGDYPQGYLHFFIKKENTSTEHESFSGDLDYLNIEESNLKFVDSLSRRLEEFIEEDEDYQNNLSEKEKRSLLDLQKNINRWKDKVVEIQIEEDGIYKMIEESCEGTPFSLNSIEVVWNQQLTIEFQHDNLCSEDLTHNVSIDYPEGRDREVLKRDLYDKLEDEFYELYLDYDVEDEVITKLEEVNHPYILDLVNNVIAIDKDLEEMEKHYYKLSQFNDNKDEREM